MDDGAVRKVGGIAGIVFGLLLAAAFVTLGDSPEFADDAETIGRFFVDNEGKLFGTAVLTMLSGFTLAWFASGIRDAITRDDDAGSVAARVVGIGAAMAAASYAVGGAILAVGAQRVSEHGEVGASSSFITYDLFQVIFGAAAPIGIAVLLSGFAVTVLRGAAVFPSWLGWVSGVIAVVGLIPPISWVVVILFAVWSIVVGTLLLRRPTAAP